MISIYAAIAVNASEINEHHFFLHGTIDGKSPSLTKELLGTTAATVLCVTIKIVCPF